MSNPGHRLFNVGMDVLSASAIVGALAQILPPLAALAGVIWYGIQIWESKTVQAHVRAWRLRKRLRRMNRE